MSIQEIPQKPGRNEKMRFVCDHINLGTLEMAAQVLGIEEPTEKTFTELEDPRLITIARSLGMEELGAIISNEEAIQRLGIEEMVSPAPENGAGMPLCEICGKPVSSKRAKTCSKECRDEKARRYALEYYHRKDKPTEDAGGGDLPPLPQAEEETFSSREWGSDPGDEPVRVAGL